MKQPLSPPVGTHPKMFCLSFANIVLIYSIFILFYFRKQSVHPPGVSKHGGPLDETRDLLQQIETHQ